MRSRSRIQAVLLDLIGEEEGGCVPTRIEVNSWVSLMPGKRGGHAKDARKHGGSNVEGSYKARILQFRLNACSTVVEEIRVQHAYMHRQLLDLSSTCIDNYWTTTLDFDSPMETSLIDRTSAPPASTVT